MTDKELGIVFDARMNAKMRFRSALRDGVDPKELSRKEHEYYSNLKWNNRQKYDSDWLFIMAYLGEVDRLAVMHTDRG